MRTNVPLLLSSLVAVVAAENNFLASCTEVRGDGSSQSRIWSCCPTRPGSTKSLTFLDLNNCLLNNFGNLGWLPNGGYLGSCSGCHVSGSEYICNCGNGRGQIQTTSINLVSF